MLQSSLLIQSTCFTGRSSKHGLVSALSSPDVNRCFYQLFDKTKCTFSTYVDVESYHYRIISSSFNTLHQVSSVDIPTCMCFQKQRGSSALEKDKKSTSRRLKRAKQQKKTTARGGCRNHCSYTG